MRAPDGMTLMPKQSRRTAEAETGIRRLLRSPPPVLARYLGFVTRLGLYPGSPALIRAVLRQNDRLVCCELHPEDAMSLAAAISPRPTSGGS